MIYVFDFVVKPIIIFALSLIFLRFAGKKAVSEMNSFDLLFVLVLGTVVSEPMVTKQLGRAMIYGAAVVVIYLVYAYASLNNKLRWLFIASPTVLIRKGNIDEAGLRKVRMTVGELISELRLKGYTKAADVEMATMEDMGKLSVIPIAEQRPLQPSDLNIKPTPTFIPIPVIMDGQIIDHNLKYLKKDRGWLNTQLRQLQVNHPHELTLAVVNAKGEIEVDIDLEHDTVDTPDQYMPGNKN